MQVKKGDRVSVNYEGRFEDGEVFDSSQHGDHAHPLEFVAGSGQVIPGFDSAVVGMKKGEKKEISIDPKDAYGEADERLTQVIPRDALPKEQEPEAGMMLMMGTPDGHQIPVRISAVDKDTVTLDLNHPLAGKKLFFTLELVGINDDIPPQHQHHHHDHGQHEHGHDEQDSMNMPKSNDNPFEEEGKNDHRKGGHHHG